MSLLRDPSSVARACRCDLKDVEAALPAIIEALETMQLLEHPRGVWHPNTLIAALATVAVECSFRPVEEAFYLSSKARTAYFNKSAYGKVDVQTKQRYYGRGFLQLTWKKSYQSYGNAIGKDLLNHPELALEPKVASLILALYFKWRKVDIAADAGNWVKCRKLVNGVNKATGLPNGLDRFLACVKELEKLSKLQG